MLFLDEAPEFPGRVLDTLRQPLESGEVVLHRAHGAARYPARFQLVLAANPCPCGNFYGSGLKCSCSSLNRRRYLGRLSGPLLDRIDIRLDVAPVARGASRAVDSSVDVAARVAAARERARDRLAGSGWALSSQVSPRWLERSTARAAALPARRAMEHGVVSARGADRALRVAWTLADLDGVDAPGPEHVEQGLALRSGARA